MQNGRGEFRAVQALNPTEILRLENLGKPSAAGFLILTMPPAARCCDSSAPIQRMLPRISRFLKKWDVAGAGLEMAARAQKNFERGSVWLMTPGCSWAKPDGC